MNKLYDSTANGRQTAHDPLTDNQYIPDLVAELLESNRLIRADAVQIFNLGERLKTLTAALHEIDNMCMGDGLDYCRSLTDPKPMTQAEMVHHASVIRGCFMGIAHKAKNATSISKSIEQH